MFFPVVFKYYPYDIRLKTLITTVFRSISYFFKFKTSREIFMSLMLLRAFQLEEGES